MRGGVRYPLRAGMGDSALETEVHKSFKVPLWRVISNPSALAGGSPNTPITARPQLGAPSRFDVAEASS